MKLEQFKVDIEMTTPQRIAACLDWAAIHFPRRPISYQHLTKIIMQLPKMPTEKDRRVESIRDATKRAKVILMDKYHRGVAAHPGYGIRATVDSSDLAETQFQNDRKRVASSVKALDRTSSLIDVNSIGDRDLKLSVNRARSAMKLLVSNDILNKLLPEKTEE